MTVLVTGGAGYIGSHMVWELLDHREKVVVIDRLSTGFEWAVAGGAHLVIGDIGDQELIEKVMRDTGVDSVIHFAGSIIVPESVSDPLGYYFNNTVKSHALIRSVVRCGIPHLIFSSTAAVYGNPRRIPVTEDEPTIPESPYGTSKLMTEWMLRDAALVHPLTYTALRYFNVSGADPAMRTGQSTRVATHLIKVASEVAAGKRRLIEVFGTDYPTTDGTCVRDYIHVSDLVKAHYLALQRLRSGAPSLVANCGYGRGYSVREVIRAVEEVSGKKLNTVEVGRRVGDAVAVVANSDVARREFDWTPKHDNLKEIVSHACAWEEQLNRRYGC